ncbi:hypothetical protein TRAPUB_13857 [Trametes pubescens]|uniref:Uncharacterized protein n=1 Tax=Trametes pubescens TaxID=154538 RepID=A0A1M2VPY3_TRAPU|nr:hypothetical protein TRAPUB_13857 [Trametes pubescens]
MQGKDVPTIFKRVRRFSQDGSLQEDGASGQAQFIPMHPNIFVLDTRGLHPGIDPSVSFAQFSAGPDPGSPFNRDFGGAGPSRALENGARFSSGAAGPSNVSAAGPSRALDNGARLSSGSAGPSNASRTNSARPSQPNPNINIQADAGGRGGGEPPVRNPPRGTVVVDDEDDDDEGGRDAVIEEFLEFEDGPTDNGDDEGCGSMPQARDSGKRRADAPRSGRQGWSRERADPRWSTFATQSEVGHIKHDLHQMNFNISRLVTLVDQQTQFFSTLQARGFFERSAPQGRGGSPPRSSPPADMDVDPPPFSSIPRRTRRGRTKEKKQKGLPIARDDADVILANNIRDVARVLMGRKNAKSPLTAEMLPDREEVNAYNRSRDGPACTVDNFRPDLLTKPSTVWNQSVIEVFIEHFMTKYPAADETRVEELFTGHLKYLCDKWDTHLKAPETQRELQKLANRTERQRNLYYRRLSVAEVYGPLRRHIPMLMKLGAHGMSSDESDHVQGVVQYGVLIKEWRSPAITKWLRVFDSMYRRLRLNDANFSTPGSHAHKRLCSTKTSSRRPPVHDLPRNAYEATWLGALNPYDRKQLGVLEYDYEFTHDPEIVKMAEDYNGQHNKLGVYA